jgi:uncharacterized protein
MSELSPSTRAWLRAFVEGGPRLLFATLSGAHLYGFESPDSDYDLRGAFVAPLESILGLSAPQETIDRFEDSERGELDWVAHDVRKFVRLMTRRNGYVLEQLYSPLVISGGPWLEELRALGAGCIISQLHHHYAGFAANQRRLLETGDETVKRLLYCYRVILTGIHVLRTGVIEADLRVLNEDQQVAGLDDLMARKREGREKGELRTGEAEAHRPALDRLTDDLTRAFESSRLPAEVTNYDALSDFVVRARLELGRE